MKSEPKEREANKKPDEWANHKMNGEKRNRISFLKALVVTVRLQTEIFHEYYRNMKKVLNNSIEEKKLRSIDR